MPGWFQRIVDLFMGPTASPVPPSPIPTEAKADRVIFRATEPFMAGVRQDLSRRHAFAHERVGFITVRAAQGVDGIVLLAEDYYPVADEDYVNDPSVGAMMGSEALRKALELALLKGVGVFHVHMHGPSRRLWFSQIDLREQHKFIPDFFTVGPKMPHGAVVLDGSGAAGRAWLAPDHVVNIAEFNIIGSRLTITRTGGDGSTGRYA